MFFIFNIMYSIIMVIIYIALYSAKSISFRYILLRQGSRYPWIAWLPYIRVSALGATTKNANGYNYLFNGRIKIDNWLLNTYWIIAIIFAFIPYIGWLLSLAIEIIGAGTIYTETYSKIEQRPICDVQILGYISGVFDIIAVIKFFIYRKKDQNNLYYNNNNRYFPPL